VRREGLWGTTVFDVLRQVLRKGMSYGRVLIELSCVCILSTQMRFDYLWTRDRAHELSHST
jgi:hypothetical protein